MLHVPLLLPPCPWESDFPTGRLIDTYFPQSSWSPQLLTLETSLGWMLDGAKESESLHYEETTHRVISGAFEAELRGIGRDSEDYTQQSEISSPVGLHLQPGRIPCDRDTSS
jgi:hypothetical protein